MKLVRYGGGEDVTVYNAMRARLEGDDYERGKLEALEVGADQTAEVLAMLIEILEVKGAFTADELQKLVGFAAEVKK